MLIGYATEASTNVLHKEDFSFIIGAPRYNHTGAVFVMETDGRMDLQKRLLLVGKQVGSYFGSSIAVADLNRDGWVRGRANLKEVLNGFILIYR